MPLQLRNQLPQSLDNGCRKARECVCSASAAAAAVAASVTDSVPVRVKWCLGNQSVTI